MNAQEIIKHKYANARHDAVCRTLLHALILNDPDGWAAFSEVSAARLDERRLAGLSFASLKAQNADNAAMTADAAINGVVPVSFLDTPNGRRALVEWREQRDRRRAR
jgi:hypothetical protein